jgi:acrylyl-CoA reductase (NADPH)
MIYIIYVHVHFCLCLFIDLPAGPTIPTIASQMAYGCSIASCGVAGGPAIKTTVYPFIIRGATASGRED